MMSVIEYSKTIGDSHLWEIVAGLLIVILFWVVAFYRLNQLEKRNKSKSQYPTLREVDKASFKQLEQWITTLPNPRRQAEVNVLDLIIEKHYCHLLAKAYMKDKSKVEKPKRITYS